MNLIEQLHRIERIDQLIRLKATGSPEQFAKRLKVSRKTLYNILKFMKNQGVEVCYCRSKRSFYYKKEVHFYYGFFSKKMDLKQVRGGIKKEIIDFFDSVTFLHNEQVNLFQQRCKGQPETLPYGRIKRDGVIT